MTESMVHQESAVRSLLEGVEALGGGSSVQAGQQIGGAQ